MEFAFPVSVLAEGAQFDGNIFRFDLKMADNTTGDPNGVTLQSFWNSAATDNQWKDTRDFGLVYGGRGPHGDIIDPIWKPQTINDIRTNPEKGYASIKDNQLAIENVFGAVTLYNLYGEALQKSIINGNGSIDIANFTPGIYFVRGNNLLAKFIK
jgi:hypothetical protein